VRLVWLLFYKGKIGRLVMSCFSLGGFVVIRVIGHWVIQVIGFTGSLGSFNSLDSNDDGKMTIMIT
jgi:hypothetical protein